MYLGPYSVNTTLAAGECQCQPPDAATLRPSLTEMFHLLTWIPRVSCCTDNKVSVTVDTLYPFSDTLTTTITAEKAFTYYVRIPSWVSKGTIAINGATPKSVSPSNGLHAVSVKAGTTKLVLDLPSEITIGTTFPCLYTCRG